MCDQQCGKALIRCHRQARPPSVGHAHEGQPLRIAFWPLTFAIDHLPPTRAARSSRATSSTRPATRIVARPQCLSWPLDCPLFFMSQQTDRQLADCRDDGTGQKESDETIRASRPVTAPKRPLCSQDTLRLGLRAKLCVDFSAECAGRSIITPGFTRWWLRPPRLHRQPLLFRSGN